MNRKREIKNLKRGERKILLFETSVEEQNKIMGISDKTNTTQFPMGLLYLSSILKINNYDVYLRDYTIYDEEHCLKAIEKEIKKLKPNFVGITVMSMTRISTYKAIKLIKSVDKNIKIILGGIHASVMYEQLLKKFPIEAICIGESEESLVELLDTIIKNKPLKNIRGIAYKVGNKVIVTGRREIKMNIEDIPYPDYDSFMKPKIKKVQLITSRGCPNKCSFCCLHLVSRQIWRPRSYKKVVDEIEYVIKRYPWIEEIEFIDDSINLDNERVVNICKEIIKRKIRLRFTCQGRIKPVSREMLYWMEKVGFEQMGFGIETGSEKLLKSIHKNITKEDGIKTFKLFKEFPKIRVAKYLIVGFPGETEETVKETIEFVKELQRIRKMGYFFAAPLWVYPGTEVYQLAVSKGAINDDYWLTDKPCPYFTLEHSEKWLMKMSNKITLETMLDQGIVFFIRKIFSKVILNPKHYIKRFLRITEDKKLLKVDHTGN